MEGGRDGHAGGSRRLESSFLKEEIIQQGTSKRKIFFDNRIFRSDHFFVPTNCEKTNTISLLSSFLLFIDTKIEA